MRAIVLIALAPLACAVEPTPSSRDIDVGEATRGAALRGISFDGDFIDLVVDHGIVQVDRSGAFVREIAAGERGLLAADYRDLAARGNDVFILLADNEGYLYDATTEQQRVHFCVEPDWEPEPGGPVLEQRNDALAVAGNLIVAAPRFYEDGVLTEAALRTYRAADGVQLASVSIGLELTGLAIAGDNILGVQGDELHRFTVDGEHVSTEKLAGIADAGGLAVDGGEIYVADATRIMVFEM
jgi:hypothetical protein